MVTVFTFSPMAEFKRESGLMVRDSTGLKPSLNKNKMRLSSNSNSLFNKSKQQRDRFSRQKQNSMPREEEKK
jgi:hypothetical protein